MWVLLVPHILLLAIYLLLQVPIVQSLVLEKAEQILEEQLQTEVKIGRLQIDLPSSIAIKELLVRDLSKDTLLYAGNISCDPYLWDLTRQRISLGNVQLQNLTGKLKRNVQDSTFNFQFIIDAFSDSVKTAKPEAKEPSPWQFVLTNGTLENIRFVFEDPVSGTDFSTQLGTLVLDIDEFDLNANRIALKDIILENTNASLAFSEVVKAVETEVQDTSTEASGMIDIDVHRLTLRNSSFEMSGPGKNTMQVKIGEFSGTLERLNLPAREVIIDELELSNSRFEMGSVASKDTVAEPFEGLNLEWKLHAQTISLSGNEVNLKQLDAPQKGQGFDPGHIYLTDMATQLEDIYVHQDTVSAILAGLSFQEQGGLSVNALKGDLFLNRKQAHVHKFLLKTPHTLLQTSTALNFPSLAALADSLEGLVMDCSIPPSYIGISDIRYLMGNQWDSLGFGISPTGTVHFSGEVKGGIKNLQINSLNAHGLDSFSLALHGKMKEVLSVDAMEMDLVLDSLTATRSFLNSLVAESPVLFPKSNHLKGKLKGTLGNMKGSLAYASDMGQASIELQIKPEDKSERFDTQIALSDFQIGKVLRQDSLLGKMSVDLTAWGYNVLEDSRKVFWEGNLPLLQLNRYDYSTLTLSGEYGDSTLIAAIEVGEEDLTAKVQSRVEIKDTIPVISLTAEIEKANITELNWSEEELRMHTRLQAELEGNSMDVMKGFVQLNDFHLFYDQDPLDLSIIRLEVDNSPSNTAVALGSEAFDGRIEGNFAFSEMPKVIKSHITGYLIQEDSNQHAHQLEMKLAVSDPVKVIKPFAHELDSMAPLNLYAFLNTEKNSFDLDLSLPNVQYGDLKLDSLKSLVQVTNKGLEYLLGFSSLQGTSFKLHHTQANGLLKRDSMSLALYIADSVGTSRFGVQGALSIQDSSYSVHLDPNGFLIDYVPWMVPVDNALHFSKGSLRVHNFSLTHQQQRILIESQQGEEASWLTVGFQQFDLSLVKRILNSEDLIGGILEGKVSFAILPEFFGLEGDLNIHQLAVLGDTLGNLALQAEMPNPEHIIFDTQLKSAKNDIQAKGQLNNKEKDPLDLALTIHHLDLQSLSGILEETLGDLSGSVQGHLNLKGELPLPQRGDGEFTFVKTGFNFKMLNTYFTVDQQKLRYQDRKMLFDQFTLIDKREKQARVDGNITLDEGFNLLLGLDVHTDDFLVLNTTQEDNDLYYGTILLTSDGKIRGTAENPIIDMSIRLNEGSQLTYVLPEEELEAVHGAGVVQFVEKNAEKELVPVEEDSLSSLISGIGIDLNTTIEIDQATGLNIIVDPKAGDHLNMTGGGTLNFKMDPLGDMKLTGVYQIENGEYQFTFYDLIKKNFTIRQGSSIIWNGDPMNATMDITASYETRTAPYGIMNRISDSEREAYRKKYWFDVNLNLDEELLEPDISFDIQISDKNSDGRVSTALRSLNEDESELNKQVFALLLFDSFISTASSSGGGMNDMMASTTRNSVSGILTDQLNNLSDKLITGVDLNFDLQSYEQNTESGKQEVTELGVQLKKQFLNDRLEVNVGGNVELSGNKTDSNTGFAENIVIEYKLTKDGRYRLKVFRNNQYDVIVDGQVIVNGVSLLFTKDYNRWKDLFRKKKKQEKANGIDEKEEKKETSRKKNKKVEGN
ncbi:translocation/assembly module TamB domain-containing protein [Rapidithrix thailandica]|uniref:Translocation/assembly module TamB domain-containing protein n=1 Tax=Rapidithrix thailandica TaxID=413964 RepID=A0AAW9S7A1_9BACT